MAVQKIKGEKMSNVAAAKSKKQEVPKTLKERAVENVKSISWALGVFYFVQTFFLQNFSIPTTSMESTLLAGDFLFVNKCIYGAQTPENIPLTNIYLPRYRFPSFREPKQGDVLVFRFPHPELQDMESQRGLDYIKRCVAGPGQVLEVKNKELYVDGKKFLDLFAIPGIHYDVNLQHDGQSVFPRNMGTGANFGPLRIPASGDEIAIDRDHYELIRYLAMRDQKRLEVKNDGAYIDGVKTEKYTVGQDYFFMMGDNRDNSLDSRYWGPVPRDHIAGQGLLIYWSNDAAAKQNSMILKAISMFNIPHIKWSRIGTVIR